MVCKTRQIAGCRVVEFCFACLCLRCRAIGDNGLRSHRDRPESWPACTVACGMPVHERCLHSGIGMNKRNLFYPRVPLFKSANDDDERTQPIRSTEVTDGAGLLHVGIRNETRHYCSSIGNRFPSPQNFPIFCSLRSPTGLFHNRTGRW